MNILSQLAINLFYTVLGATLFYSTWGRKRLKVFLLSELLINFGLSERTQILLEFIIFLVFGCAISVGIVHPQNPAQAFSAGLGWTGLVGKPK